MNTLFDNLYEDVKITKPIRLIELFAGYGSQAMALKRIGVKFEHYKVVEFDKYAISSYNAVHGTNFSPLDITQIHACDLEIRDTINFTYLLTYLLTYSFPCTDLSIAGNRQGMSKDGGTRSGLLWEVERILTEIKESDGELPQILFMENVTQVHGHKNMPDFLQWIYFLESLGYMNYWEDLNAKDYGIPQNRNRCFMFSLLGDYKYDFPKPINKNVRVQDLLENEVADKFYLKKDKATKLIEQLIEKNVLDTFQDKETIFARKQGTDYVKKTDVASTICARDYKGLKNRDNGTVIVDKIKIKQATKQGFIEMESGGGYATPLTQNLN